MVGMSGVEDIYREQYIKRYLKGIHVCVFRCNERLNVKTETSTRLAYTGLSGELERLKIEKRLLGESFECGMVVCDLDVIGVPSMFQLIRSGTVVV